MSMTRSREIYPHAPAALVAVEARHTAAAPLTPEQEQAVKILIADDFPLAQPIPTISFSFGPGSGASSVAQTAPPRFTNRTRTAAVTFGPQAVVVETTQHDSFAALSTLLGVVVTARQTVAPVDGLERLGLRYIDEIRVPEAEPVDWTQWVNAALLGPAALAAPFGLALVEHQAIARFSLTEGRGLPIAPGAPHAHAVAPPLRVASPPPSPRASPAPWWAASLMGRSSPPDSDPAARSSAR